MILTINIDFWSYSAFLPFLKKEDGLCHGNEYIFLVATGIFFTFFSTFILIEIDDEKIKIVLFYK